MDETQNYLGSAAEEVKSYFNSQLITNQHHTHYKVDQIKKTVRRFLRPLSQFDYKPRKLRKENKKDILFKLYAHQPIQEREQPVILMENLPEEERQRQIQTQLQQIYQDQKNQVERTIAKVKQVFYKSPGNYKKLLDFQTATANQLRMKMSQFDQKRIELQRFDTLQPRKFALMV